MQAGFAEIVITPPAGRCLLAGYNLRPSTGVHDDLYATAVYFVDGATHALLVSFDLLAMERELIARIKAALQDSLIAPSGPDLFYLHPHTRRPRGARNASFVTVGMARSARIISIPIWHF